jgi:transcriptional regulator with XRE-family HTH domain
LSIYRLAIESGTSTAHLSRIEAGRVKAPSVDLACRIARALGTTVDDLAGNAAA